MCVYIARQLPLAGLKVLLMSGMLVREKGVVSERDPVVREPETIMRCL